MDIFACAFCGKLQKYEMAANAIIDGKIYCCDNCIDRAGYGLCYRCLTYHDKSALVSSEDGTICRSCVSKYAPCRDCGTLIRKDQHAERADGSRICDQCRERLIFCDHCKQWHAKTDQTIIAGSCVFCCDVCARCAGHAPCDDCGKWEPVKKLEYLEVYKKYICDRCTVSYNVCYGCGEMFLYSELFFDYGADHYFCESCDPYGAE